jgi:hypothetical protein
MTQLIYFSRSPMSHLMERVIGPIIVALTLCTTLAQNPSQGRLSLWFRQSDLSDPVVICFSDDSIKILDGALLGDDSTVYRIQRVLMNKTHVAIVVVESMLPSLLLNPRSPTWLLILSKSSPSPTL